MNPVVLSLMSLSVSPKRTFFSRNTWSTIPTTSASLLGGAEASNSSGDVDLRKLNPVLALQVCC